MNITEILVPAQQTAWLPWAVQYFFYIGSAYAAAILFFISLIFNDKSSHAMRSALALVMAICAIVGPLALTADLHQPGRAWHFFVHLTPWSWMSKGSILLPIFSMLTVATTWLYLRNDLAKFKTNSNKLLQKVALLTLGDWQVSRKLMLSIAGLTVLSGLSIALYTGMEVYKVASRPLWNQAASPLIWFATAFLGALGLTLIVLVMQKAQAISEFDKRLVQKTMMLSSVAGFILMVIWASNAGDHSLFAQLDWCIRLGTLLVLFSLCALMGRVMIAPKLSALKVMAVAVVGAVTCWQLRWVTMMDVQMLPKYDHGPYPYELPLGSNGLLGIIAMAGLWIAIAALASELVDAKDTSSKLTHSNLNQLDSSNL